MSFDYTYCHHLSHINENNKITLIHIYKQSIMFMCLVVHATHKSSIYKQKACETDCSVSQAFMFIDYLPYLTVDLSYIPFGIALIPAIRFEYCSLSFEFSAY